MTKGQVWVAEQRKLGLGPRVRTSLSEVFALFLKAGTATGLPLGHTQSLAAAAGWFACSPDLMIEVTGALMRKHSVLKTSQRGDILVITGGGALMAAPSVVEALLDGSPYVRLTSLDFPTVLYALLTKAESDYGIYIEKIEERDGTVTVGLTDSGAWAKPGELSPVPTKAICELSNLAAKTYVPASDASRLLGAGASLDDND